MAEKAIMKSGSTFQPGSQPIHFNKNYEKVLLLKKYGDCLYSSLRISYAQAIALCAASLWDGAESIAVGSRVNSHTQSHLHRGQSYVGLGATPENADMEHLYNSGLAARRGCTRLDRTGHNLQHSHLRSRG